MPKLYHNGHAWQVPGQQDAGATRVDVPTSPADAAAWLNARRVPSSIDAGGSPAELPPQLADARNTELEEAIARNAETMRTHALNLAEQKAATAARAIERDSAEHVAAWIFDQATPAQVEQLFAAIGARFHELRKETGK